MASAIEVEYTTPFITAQKGVPPQQIDGRHSVDSNPPRSPEARFNCTRQTHEQQGSPNQDSVVDYRPFPVRVVPLSSGWFDSACYDCTQDDNQQQRQDQHLVATQQPPKLAAVQPQLSPRCPTPLANHSVAIKQSNSFQRILASLTSTTLHLARNRRQPSVSPLARFTNNKLPSHPSRADASAYEQCPAVQSWWSDDFCPGPAAATTTTPVDLALTSSQSSKDGTAVVSCSAVHHGVLYSKDTLSQETYGSQHAEYMSTLGKCQTVLQELPSVREDTDANTWYAAAAPSAHTAVPGLPVSSCMSCEVIVPGQKQPVLHRRGSLHKVGHCHSRRIAGPVATTTTAGRAAGAPRGALGPAASLRTALVALETASSQAGRLLLDKMSQGLARMTSVTGNLGLPRQSVAREVLKDWELGPELGHGATCITRLALARHNGQTAACKTIHKAGIFRSAAVKVAILGVQRELAIMQHTSGHPNVVQLLGVYEDNRSLHLIMEWCGGGSLAQLAERIPGGQRGELVAAAVAKAVLEVLALCHEKGVVHRDIKLDNLLLSRPVDQPEQIKSGMIKVTDFGISVPYMPGQVLSELAGTLEYMAPEVLQRNYCQQADIWSTGVVLYELIAGRTPYSGDTVEQMLESIKENELDLLGAGWESVSDDAKTIVGLMLTKDPAKRPSARDLLQAFEGWLQQGC